MDKNNLKQQLAEKGISKIGVYLRKSRDDKKELDVLSKHRKDIQSTFDGLSTDLMYYEEIGSSESFEWRDELQRMIKDIELNKIDAVAVVESGRLTKSNGDYERFSRFMREHNKYLIITNNNRIIDFKDSMDRQTTKFDVFAKSLHQDYTKELLMQGRIRSAKEGNWVNTTTPLGFSYVNDKDAIDNKKLRINEKEALVIKEIFRLYVDERESIRGVEKRLNAKGYVNRKGKIIKHTTLGRMLKNQAYVGTSANRLCVVNKSSGKHKKVARDKSEWIIVENAWKPIIERDVFDEAQRRLKANSIQKYHSYEDRTYYRGKIYCNKCGVQVWIRNSTETRYNRVKSISIEKCSCGHRGATLTPTPHTEGIDSFMARELPKRITHLSNSILSFHKNLESNNKLSTSSNSKEVRAIRIRISEINGYIEKLHQGYEQGVFTPEDVKERKDMHTTTIKQLKDDLYRLENKSNKPSEMFPVKMLELTFQTNIIRVMNNWLNLPVKIKRNIFNLLVKSITYNSLAPEDAPRGGRALSYELNINYRDEIEILNDKDNLRLVAEMVNN